MLIRQPLMNGVIGNPARVVLAMAAGPWLTWLAMGVVVAVLWEAVFRSDIRKVRSKR